jgi:hypothetical protein
VSLAGNHLLAQLQFKRDYYKQVISKRLAAYEQVDEIIGILRGTTYDDRGRVVHMLFANDGIYMKASLSVGAAVAQGLYLSEEIREPVRQINLLLLQRPAQATERLGFAIGVEHRETLASLRVQLERCVANDLLSLHRVKRFLKSKCRIASAGDPGHLIFLPKHGAFAFDSSEESTNPEQSRPN